MLYFDADINALRSPATCKKEPLQNNRLRGLQCDHFSVSIG